MNSKKADRLIQIVFFIWLAVSIGFCLFSAKLLPSVPKTSVSAAPFTDKQLAAWYATYNERYFSGRLPKNTVVRWNFLEDKYGETEPPADGRFVILLDISRNRESIMARITLLHEMCHVATYDKGFDHGLAWRAEIHRLMMEGAFDDLI